MLVCVGSGGVGKTTMSAALALRAASMGRRVLVLTVDPARRLANALGMASMPVEPVRIELAGGCEGELWAQMLDTKSTFDELVGRHAANEEERRRILDNPFYVKASTSLPGSDEYLAMEQLLIHHESERFDLLVLDTPPSPTAISFLDAPRRLLAFLDSASARLLVQATVAVRAPLSLFRVSSIVIRGVARFVGSDFFKDLLDFIHAFEGMFEGFAERARSARDLLCSQGAGFVIVHAPEQATLEEAASFDDMLTESGMRVRAFLANRVHRPAPFDLEDAGARLQERLVDRPAIGLVGAHSRARLKRKLERVTHDQELLAGQDERALAVVRARAADRTEPVPVVVVPHFDEDIHDLAGLSRFAGGAEVLARD